MPYIKEAILNNDKFRNCREFARHMTERYGAGWDEGMISRIVNGRCYPTPANLGIMCRELDCTLGQLYTADELHEIVDLGLQGLLAQARHQEEHNGKEEVNEAGEVAGS